MLLSIARFNFIARWNVIVKNFVGPGHDTAAATPTDIIELLGTLFVFTLKIEFMAAHCI